MLLLQPLGVHPHAAIEHACTQHAATSDADPVVEAVVDGAQVQVVGFDDAKVAFDGIWRFRFVVMSAKGYPVGYQSV
jgi:hypothetical protein